MQQTMIMRLLSVNGVHGRKLIAYLNENERRAQYDVIAVEVVLCARTWRIWFWF